MTPITFHLKLLFLSMIWKREASRRDSNNSFLRRQEEIGKQCFWEYIKLGDKTAASRLVMIYTDKHVYRVLLFNTVLARRMCVWIVNHKQWLALLMNLNAGEQRSWDRHDSLLCDSLPRAILNFLLKQALLQHSYFEYHSTDSVAITSMSNTQWFRNLLQ